MKYVFIGGMSAATTFLMVMMFLIAETKVAVFLAIGIFALAGWSFLAGALEHDSGESIL